MHFHKTSPTKMRRRKTKSEEHSKFSGCCGAAVRSLPGPLHSTPSLLQSAADITTRFHIGQLSRKVFLLLLLLLVAAAAAV